MIRVNLPNGQVANFPSDMSNDEIQNVLRKHFGFNEQQEPDMAPGGGFKQGLGEIANDIYNSVIDAPGAAVEGLMGIPGAIKSGAQYALENPLKAAGQMALGAPETAAALTSLPGQLYRYLGRKFAPESQFTELAEQKSTPLELMQNVEQQLGIEATEPGESALRGLGGMLVGGGALSKIPSRLGRVGTVAGTVAGAGGDPVQGALAAYLGEKGFGAAKGARKTISEKMEFTKLKKELPKIEQNINNAYESISKDLGKGQDFATRSVNLIKNDFDAIKKPISQQYENIKSELSESKVKILNSERMQAIDQAINSMVEKGILAAENDAGFNKILSQLQEKWPGDKFKEVSGADFVDIYKSARDSANIARKKSLEPGIDQAERLRWKQKAESLKPVADAQYQILQENLPAKILQDLANADTAWRKEVIPFYSSKVFQKAVNQGKGSKNIIQDLAGVGEGDIAMQNLIRNNPELNRIALGQRFSDNPAKLLEFNEMAYPYLEKRPEILKMIEKQKEDLSKIERIKEIKTAEERKKAAGKALKNILKGTSVVIGYKGIEDLLKDLFR